MNKLTSYLKRNWVLIFLILLSIPSFYRMLQFGMYSTQDFHIFRLVQFDKCIQLLQIPCRWAPDAGLGYGEPLFNFYGQFPYAVGEIYHLLGGSFINSIKFLFILSLIGSALSMFLLARHLWKNNAAGLMVSALYLYAPYRSVDVWVRGALPEALAFVFFPLIILSVEHKSVKWLSLLSALLIITHNLSFVMFLPILIVWIFYRKFWKGFISFAVAGLLTSFYILPVFMESKFVMLESTINGFFDYHNHYATLKQLFVSNYWGYGSSHWGPDDEISLSIGYLQWGVPLLTLCLLFLKRKLIAQKQFLILIILGIFYLFMTHNKSTPVWEFIPSLSYIQFPWRFLSMVIFCFALASGSLLGILGNIKYAAVFTVIGALFIVNIPLFRPDIWYSVNDSYYLTGEEWNRQRSASIADFWPKFGHEIPVTPGNGLLINYFPGWVSSSPQQDGLILSEGSKFVDTPVRRIGNIISLLTLVIFTCFVLKNKKWTRKT